MTENNYADDIALVANRPTQVESLLHSLKQSLEGIDLHMNVNKMNYMCFNLKGVISTQNRGLLKSVDESTSPGSCILSTEKDVNIRLAKSWSAINCLLIILKCDLSDKR